MVAREQKKYNVGGRPLGGFAADRSLLLPADLDSLPPGYSLSANATQRNRHETPDSKDDALFGDSTIFNSKAEINIIRVN